MSVTTHSPAQVLRAVLLAAGLGVDPDVDPDSEWPIYVNHMPDEGAADKAIFVYDTSGTKDGRLLASGTVIEHPGFQVRLRALDHPTVWAKLKAVADYIDAAPASTTVAVGGTTYAVRNISRTGTPLNLGTQGAPRRRQQFTLNGILTIAET